MLDLDVDMDAMSLLKFKDFVPQQLSKPSPWTGRGEYQSLTAALLAANQWMSAHPHLDIINVETVVLPAIHSPKEEGSADTELLVQTGGMPQPWHQFIRVWYVERKG
ncbi:MAG: hypothetical protein D6722_12180 [Bacteroidetes bacterium]|nr:MAG: hypothetical protein D6722_12180 [Bacteroidota bacterium]